MLCEIDAFGNFLSTWLFLTILGVLSVFVMSGLFFKYYYMNPTFETWQRKSNPAYPTPEMVRSEIIQMMKGVVAATICPAASLYMARTGQSMAYCGWQHPDYPITHSYTYLLGTFVLVMLAVDFFEWAYHRLGHTTDHGWSQHKYHHLFYNPSPFAVIADEYIDQFVRATPLVIFPLIAPINMDLFFGIFVFIFYAYGVYLHCGFEWDWPDAHHPWINTSFQHYCHHAVSFKNKPYWTGFFVKFWDQLAGSTYTKKCFCVKCERAEGLRSFERWEKISKSLPNYSVLLEPSFWLTRDALNFEKAPTEPGLKDK